MKANLKRDGDNARWYYPILMKGEWPVLLKILGKGEGKRALPQRRRSQDAVRRAAAARADYGAAAEAGAGGEHHLNSGVPWHEGVERRPELSAIAVLLLQDLVL